VQLFHRLSGSIYVEELPLEDILKKHYFVPTPIRSFLDVRTFLACLALVGAGAVTLFAQQGAMSPYQGEKDGVTAGGSWMEFKSEDKMTAAKRVRFELLSKNYFREDPDYKPRVEMICEDGKYKIANFNPGVRIRPNRPPGWYGQPQIEVEVRVDDVHNYHGWNWVPGQALAMDKGTTRGMIGAQVFNIALPTSSGRQIAEFAPAGLNLDEVHQMCDITPKKPSRD
jgi:hypothetical protein